MNEFNGVLFRNVRPVSIPDAADDSPIDILIDDNGRIASSDAFETLPSGAKAVECNGAFVSPGWMDLHAHIYHGVTDSSVRPSDCGLSHGVTTIVDAGSAGERNFPGFREYIVDAAAERIHALINIGSIGLVAGNDNSEVPALSALDLDRTLVMIDKHRDVIKGVKVRASRQVVGDMEMLPVCFAKQAAALAGLPLMVHIGVPPCFVEGILDLLTPGDIITHCFHHKAAGTSLLNNPPLFERCRNAADQGIIFDIGHGRSSFSFPVADYCLSRDFLPTTISTDIHLGNINAAVVDFAHVLSKFLSLGMTAQEIVSRATLAPRKALNLPCTAFLKPGTPADLTIFDIEDADAVLPDSKGVPRPITRLFAPRWAILGDKLVRAGRRELPVRDIK